MLILAIDSSEDMGSVSVAEDDRLLADYQFYTKMSLLRRLVPSIEQVVSDAGHKVKDVDGIAVALGPGSFTGLRIGVTTAKTLAFSLSKPIIGVPTLDALARGAVPTSAEVICPMIYARAGEVYWALYDPTGDERITDYVAGPLKEAINAAAERSCPVCFCGSGAARNAEALRHRFGRDALICDEWDCFVQGRHIIQLARRRFREDRPDDAMTLAPLYIRKPTPVVKLESGEFDKDNHAPPTEGHA